MLSYLRAAGVLKDKNSKILVPPWLGYWVYNVMHRHGFPVLHPDPEVRVAVVYHQYGFPQDMDAIRDYAAPNRVVLIEDCAHSLMGAYRGTALGSFGRAGVFSYSKFVPSLIGGAVRSADEELRAHVRNLEKRGSRAIGWLSLAVKLALEHESKARKSPSLAVRINELSYAGYPYARRVWLADRLHAGLRLEEELHARRRNYALYRRLLPAFEEIQAFAEDVSPYVLPLLGPPIETLRGIAAALRQDGIATGIYSFDTHRNLFDPQYQPCVWLPVHSGITEERVERIAEIVRRHA